MENDLFKTRWHKQVWDEFIAHPELSVRELAQRLGRTPSTIGYALTDVFKRMEIKRLNKIKEENL